MGGSQERTQWLSGAGILNKVRNATWDEKSTSVAFWGEASDKIGKQFICDNCMSNGELWEAISAL